MASMHKKSLIATAAIFCCRFTGLLREVVYTALFGATGALDAFLTAFRVPNMLRDMFAEGALSQSFTSVMSKVEKQDGKEAAWTLASRVSSQLISLMLCIVSIGILLAGVIGILTGSFTAIGWMGAMGEGIMGMSELIIVTLLAGGMLALIRHNGGIDYLIRALTLHINGKRGAKFTIALLVILADMCTANNTIALVTVGPMAKEIANKYGIDKRISASLLDTFSCFTQGFLPYGAQMLMAAGLAHITPFEIIGYLYYPMALGVIALLGILFNYPRKYA